MFPYREPDNTELRREQNRKAVEEHFARLPTETRKAIRRARKFLQRKGLSQVQLLNDTTLSQIAALLDSPRTERDDAREVRYKELLACRNNVGKGNDEAARDRAIALEAVSATGSSLFDTRVRLYCEQVRFVVGESMSVPDPELKQQTRADDLVRGWAVQRDYLNVAITLIEQAHMLRLTGMAHESRIEREYKKAAAATKAALDLLEGLCRDRNPRVVNWLKHEASFHRFKIANETGDEDTAESELLHLRQIGEKLGNTQRVQTDNLQAEIGYLIFRREFEKAEELLSKANALWSGLTSRSPYTWFNFKYLELALEVARKSKAAAIHVLDEYLRRWEQFPQLFYLVRLERLPIQHLPRRRVRQPRVFTSRASLFYLEDLLAKRE